MMCYVREFRLIPVVLLATICLFALKVFGLVLDGGYTLKETDLSSNRRLVIDSAANTPATGGIAPASDANLPTRLSWAQEMFNFPDLSGALPNVRAPDTNSDHALVTGSVDKKTDEKPPDKATAAPPPQPGGTLIPVDGSRMSAGERAILERLGERRQELDARARELEIRENLLKSAEKRLETRGSELKELESRATAAPGKKGETQAVQLKSLVIMYENMKAKDAAKIFDRLDMRVLIEVASAINPRRMADIMAQMTPEAAERLTVEMANRATSSEKILSGNDLPKIEGRPGT